MDAWRNEVDLGEAALVDIDEFRDGLAEVEMLCAACDGGGSLFLGAADYDPCPVCDGGGAIDGWTGLKLWASNTGDWDGVDDETTQALKDAGERVALASGSARHG